MSGQAILPGSVCAPVLATDEGLSFWGGVDPLTGLVIDVHHPLCGHSIAGKVLVMPTTRGSCSGSGVILDLALNGLAPAAFVFREAEDIVTLGAMIAGRMFDRPVPVVRLGAEAFARAASAQVADLTDTALTVDGATLPLAPLPVADLDLTAQDRAMLAGEDGAARRIAMEVICAMAALQGAGTLLDVTQGHIDGCILANAANLRFAEKMAGMGARVGIPTTINAISVDHGNWRTQGVAPDFGLRAARLADAYVHMGARPTFTCAPYLLDTAPQAGERIGWSESNAVIYANTVLAARTVKHPDYLDLFIAMTGRAPLSGVYLDGNRAPRRAITRRPVGAGRSAGAARRRAVADAGLYRRSACAGPDPDPDRAGRCRAVVRRSQGDVRGLRDNLGRADVACCGYHARGGRFLPRSPTASPSHAAILPVSGAN